MTAPVGSASDTSPSPTLPRKPGQSHVEILDSNRACESAAGFQSCAHDPISIPMLRPFAENWPHAIALPLVGREQTEFAAPTCTMTRSSQLVHRSLSVDNPASASTTEMIQKRITIC